MQNIATPQKRGTLKHKQIDVEGISIFYREAGDPKKETVLMLHGFPSSSHMYRELLIQLSDEYHVIAPDYPGFGLSSAPLPSEFEYSFDNVARLMERFIDALSLDSFYLLMQDYGGPIGLRIATNTPELIKGLIIQNANAYMEGLGEWAMKIGAFHQNDDLKGLEAYKNHLISLEGIKEQYLTGSGDGSRVDPISYLMDNAFLNRDNAKEIQSTMFYNYGSNFPKYTEWQNYFRTHQPRTLILWGENDRFFSKAGGEAYAKDLSDLETHFFDGGHFMLEEYPEEAASLIKEFLDKA